MMSSKIARVFRRAAALLVVVVGSPLLAMPTAEAEDFCRPAGPAIDWYAVQGTGRYEDWHPVLVGPWGRKTADLKNGRQRDFSFGEFSQGYNKSTDRIWLDYRMVGRGGWNQCGPTNGSRSENVKTHWEGYNREVRVCIDTLWQGARKHDCADQWWKDTS